MPLDLLYALVWLILSIDSEKMCALSLILSKKLHALGSDLVITWPLGKLICKDVVAKLDIEFQRFMICFRRCNLMEEMSTELGLNRWHTLVFPFYETNLLGGYCYISYMYTS